MGDKNTWIGTVRIFSVIVWTQAFGLLKEFGILFSEDEQASIVAVTAVLVGTVAYYGIQYLAKTYPKYLWWLQYLLLLPTSPDYHTKKEDK